MPCAHRSNVKIHKLNSGLEAYFTTFLNYPLLANFRNPTAATKCNVAGVKADKNTNLSDKDPHGTKFICNSETLDKTQTAIEKQKQRSALRLQESPRCGLATEIRVNNT